ncbi:MAG: hypothetical protein CVU57_31425 [Deltaproteobacteria bacterium HGW-Deltaproteobacteria-15]|nr:MAG: hypothetical protein CVU57_31425 [Deltaproteobacteria bacterium HGW-Deltaproteobacteria-15]
MKVPSYWAAIITGAIGMPVFVVVLRFLEHRSAGQLALVVWFLLGFGLPLLVSTGDFEYIRQEMKNGRSFFGPWVKTKDFKEFYVPAWKRIFVWFLASCGSIMLLKTIGVDF